MIVLIPYQTESNIEFEKSILPIVLIFGIGLIGNSIVEKLFSLFPYKVVKFNFLWSNKDQQLDVLRQLVLLTNNSCYVEVIWSAGKAGFFSEKHEIDDEFEIFKNILDFIGNNINCDKSMRLISSAGGLYEGGRRIGRNSKVAPKRLYGELKQRQENYLFDIDGYKYKSIIRLSSIYGYIKKDQRAGLIPTLIKNTIENKETKIFGYPYTLRDYLFIDDMARFFSEKIFMNKNDYIVFLLSSNKPTSIFEIVKIVEHALNKKILINFISQKNSDDITYYENNRLCEQYLTPLNVGVRKILLHFSHRMEG